MLVLFIDECDTNGEAAERSSAATASNQTDHGRIEEWLINHYALLMAAATGTGQKACATSITNASLFMGTH
jgi:hypothetical protein